MFEHEDGGEWKPPTSYHILLLGSLQLFVDDEEARRIRKFVAANERNRDNALNVSIDVTTLYGEPVHMTLGAYYGLIGTTEETRRREREHDRAVKQERAADPPSFS
jgi:hypothetical protein